MNISDVIVSLSSTGQVNTTEFIVEKIEEFNKGLEVAVDLKRLDQLKGWQVDDHGNVRHASGKFFSIVGLNIRSNIDVAGVWDQPIIDQPEIGYLGFVSRKVKGVLHFLVQMKIEPGNKNKIQLSPTLQATRSNYTQVHAGNKPHFLEPFLDPRSIVHYDQLCSEQGARFYKKRNRNIIIEVDEIEEGRFHHWLSLKQIKDLMRIDDLVNMDTRTVLSMIRWYSSTKELSEEVQALVKWVVSKRFVLEYEVNRKPISELNNWGYKNGFITHNARRHFTVVGAGITIEGREVKSWDQPLIMPEQHGIIALIIKKIGQNWRALITLKHECGLVDGVEFSPTLSARVGSDLVQSELGEYIMKAIDRPSENQSIYVDVFQSEEGGRFYEDSNRNVIIVDQGNFTISADYKWVSIEAVVELINIGGYVNIQLRNLISMINPLEI